MSRLTIQQRSYSYCVLFCQVVSDKVLVKQLQKEVARLEAELKVPDSVTDTATSEALLQAKDLQIQKVFTIPTQFVQCNFDWSSCS